MLYRRAPIQNILYHKLSYFFKTVLNDPVQCENGHCFCGMCLKSALRVKSECPNCRVSMDINHLPANLLVKNMINDLYVRCVNSCVGCEWTGKLSQISSHKRDCIVELVPCPLFSHGCIPSCNGMNTLVLVIDVIMILTLCVYVYTHVCVYEKRSCAKGSIG